MEADVKIKLLIAYDGSGFSGWQMQAGARTVQDTLKGALTTLLGEPVAIFGAGRTDSGVHASGQVAHFDLLAPRVPPERIKLALPGLLTPEILVMESSEAEEDFHACFSAKARVYRYRFTCGPLFPWLRNFCVKFPEPFDKSRMEAALAPLVGRRDFTSFSLRDCEAKTRVRDIRRITVEETAGGFDLIFEADGFLRKMIRLIIGTLLRAYVQKGPAEHIAAVLEARDNKHAAAPAPPGGLYLERVDYF